MSTKTQTVMVCDLCQDVQVDKSASGIYIESGTYRGVIGSGRLAKHLFFCEGCVQSKMITLADLAAIAADGLATWQRVAKAQYEISSRQAPAAVKERVR